MHTGTYVVAGLLVGWFVLVFSLLRTLAVATGRLLRGVARIIF